MKYVIRKTIESKFEKIDRETFYRNYGNYCNQRITLDNGLELTSILWRYVSGTLGYETIIWFYGVDLFGVSQDEFKTQARDRAKEFERTYSQWTEEEVYRWVLSNDNIDDIDRQAFYIPHNRLSRQSEVLEILKTYPLTYRKTLALHYLRNKDDYLDMGFTDTANLIIKLGNDCYEKYRWKHREFANKIFDLTELLTKDLANETEYSIIESIQSRIPSFQKLDFRRSCANCKNVFYDYYDIDWGCRLVSNNSIGTDKSNQTELGPAIDYECDNWSLKEE